jgi:hypothetical protein
MSDRPPLPAPPDYVLSIEALVLDGFEAADPAAVTSALRRELVRLLTVTGGPFDAAPTHSAAAQIRHVQAGGPALTADASPREIGQAVARTIVGQFGGAVAGRSTTGGAT